MSTSFSVFYHFNILIQQIYKILHQLHFFPLSLYLLIIVFFKAILKQVIKMSRLQSEIGEAIQDEKREIVLKGEGDELTDGKLPDNLFELKLLNYLDVSNLPGLFS